MARMDMRGESIAKPTSVERQESAPLKVDSSNGGCAVTYPFGEWRCYQFNRGEYPLAFEVRELDESESHAAMCSEELVKRIVEDSDSVLAELNR